MAPRSRDVFLNVPFDNQGERPFMALIAGLVLFGLKPRTVLEIPPQQSRLDRLVKLIGECKFSIHDLSRVGVSQGGTFRVPRFNMPFELGLAVAISMSGRSHQWWVLESVAYRLPVSLSDLSGYDHAVYGGTVRGIYRALSDAFVLDGPRPSESEFMRVYAHVRNVKRHHSDLYRPSAYKQLVMAATFARTASR